MQEEDTLFYTAYKPICAKHEGDVEHFYLDSQGHLTIGRGHLVAKRVTGNKTYGAEYIWQIDENKTKTLVSLQPYLYLHDKSRLAQLPEIDKDVQEVIDSAQKGFNYYASYYNSPSRLKFTGIEETWRQDISEKLLYLRTHNQFFKDAATPFEAKLVLLDIAYQSGEGYLTDKPSKRLSHNNSFYKSFFVSMRTAMLNSDLNGLYQAVSHLDHYLLYKKSMQQDRDTWRMLMLEQAINHPAILSSKNPTNYNSAIKTALAVFKQSQISVNSPARPHKKHHKQPIGVLLPQADGVSGPAVIPGPIGLPDNLSARIASPAFEDIDINSSVWADALLKIKAPIPDAFIVSQLTGYEGISQAYQFHITVYSQNTDIQAQQLLTKPIAVQLNDETKQFKRYFHGVVSRMVAGLVRGGWRQYTLEMVPTMDLLNWESNHRIFRNMSVIDLIKKLLDAHHIPVDAQHVKRQLPKRDYCVQYGETTLNFIHRLLEDEGIFYYFIHEENKHTLILADHVGGYQHQNKPSLTYAGDSMRSGEISYWEKQSDYYTGEFFHSDYNFLTPQATLQAKQESQPKLAAANKSSWHEHPGKFSELSMGKPLAQLRAEAEEAWHEWVEAVSNVPLFSGQLFSLVRHPDSQQVGDYVVATVHHYAHDATHHKSRHNDQAHLYHGSFKALPAKITARPKQHTHRPKIHGHQTATVVGDGQESQEAHIDKHGRVCVHFHWDREHKHSCWVRVAHRWAGKHWGMIFHPRIGQEVIVNFEHGDPDRPLIIGSVHNANNMPPYELPLHHTRSGLKTRSTKKGASTQYNEMHFEDKAGEQNIFWRAEKDFTRVIEHTETTLVKQGNQRIRLIAGKSSLEAAKAIELKVGSNTLKMDAKGIFINGQQIKFGKAI